MTPGVYVSAETNDRSLDDVAARHGPGDGRVHMDPAFLVTSWTRRASSGPVVFKVDHQQFLRNFGTILVGI